MGDIKIVVSEWIISEGFSPQIRKSHIDECDQLAIEAESCRLDESVDFMNYLSC